MHAPDPSHLISLPDGRRLAVDDVGDPAGTPVLYLHGTPDTRRARHPDDARAAVCGVRLLAMDRPGFGASSPDAAATFGSFGADVGVALDALGVAEVRLLAWSAGAPWALGVAEALGRRVVATAVVAGTVPVEAYDDPTVAEAAGPARLAMVEAARDLGALDAAEFMGPMLVPDPLTWELAREQLEGHDPVTRAELAGVPGALDRMAEAMLDSVAAGPAGLVCDVARAYCPSGLSLGRVSGQVALWYGEADPTCPPAFGRWYAGQLPIATMRVVAGAGHALLLTHWDEVLRDLCTSTRNRH
jgi:pimeloyl-ACP methyl ester carboxylesterase